MRTSPCPSTAQGKSCKRKRGERVWLGDTVGEGMGVGVGEGVDEGVGEGQGRSGIASYHRPSARYSASDGKTSGRNTCTQRPREGTSR